MREGLRSSANSFTKINKGETCSPTKVTVGKNLDDSKQKDSDWETEEDTLVSTPKEVIDGCVKNGLNCQGWGGGISISEVKAVIFNDTARKRDRIHAEGESEDAGIEKKVMKDEVVIVPVVGRVLRSRSAVKSEGDGEKTERVVTGKRTRGSDGSGKKEVEVKNEELDYFEGEVSDDSDNEARKKVKRGRGRPPKAQENDGSQKRRVEETNEPAGKDSYPVDNVAREKLKRKRGRPRKSQQSAGLEMKSVGLEKEEICQYASDESDSSCGKKRKKPKCKRGRPPKIKNSEKVGTWRKSRRDMKPRGNLYHKEGNCQLSSKRVVRKNFNAKQLVSAEKVRCGDDGNGGKTKQNTGTIARSHLRQVVRDKIVDLLLAAGWTIEYRPRNGRDYNDAVYVNPEGRTHWSVTLAYKVLKKQHEDVAGDSNDCNTGFKFTPIPEEELNILTKVISKERSDKHKRKKKWTEEGKGKKTVEGLALKKRRKGKLHKSKLVNAGNKNRKKLKGRVKLKASLGEHDDSAGTSDKGAAASVGDCKRLKTHDRKRCALLVRNSKDSVECEGNGYVLYNGKRTVLAWMINLSTVPLNGKVQYFRRRKSRVLKGRIMKDGIQCDCCNETLTVSEFEIHAGCKTSQPLKNIYLENGPSLLQCQLETWNKQDESARKGFHFVNVDGEDPNDDTCGICGDGGDLICCDGCPSTFHQNCLEIKKFPSGVWHCMYCSCKFCGSISEDICQRDNDATVTPTLPVCCLCEEKYHKLCIPAEDDINDDPSISFCGKKCQELYERLQKLLGVKHELEEGFSWSLVRRFDVDSDISLGGMPRKVECNSKVAVALDVLDECFLPMTDHRSGVNLIRNIVYNFGSNFNRLNYSGFFTAILERGDEIVAAASVRIHGNCLAEMPFIGTRHVFRRQGMCRWLLTAIETALCSLHVEKLIIPAISELREMWTSVFGFKPIERLGKQMMRNMNMMVFPGVDMLQKPLLEHHFEAKDMTCESLKSTLPKEHQIMNDSIDDSDERCSIGFDSKVENETSVPAGNDDPVTVEFGLSLPYGCLNDRSDITSENILHANMVNGEVAVVESNSLVPDSCLNDTSDITSEKVSRSLNLHLNLNEPATAEFGSLLNDDCFNDTSYITSEFATHEKGIDLSGVIPSIAKQNKNTPNPLFSVHSVLEQSMEVTEHQKAVSGSTIVDESIPESDAQLSQKNISQEESKLSVECDVSAEHILKACVSNGHCNSTEVISYSYGVNADGVHELKGSNAAQNNAPCVDGCSIFDGPQIDLAIHCASGGGNPCALLRL